MKSVQIYSRLLYYIRCYLIRAKVDLNPAPLTSRKSTNWIKSICRKPSITAPNSFFFLNKTGKLDEVGWNGDNREKLWRYNQHYFDDLNALNADDRRMWHYDLIKRWIKDNPPGTGVGWNPYPLSLRIVNWIKWSLANGDLNENAIHSLAIQLRWLTKNLETHLLGNHLIINAKALVFGGLFFEGEEADNWLNTGMKLLQREVNEQILSDGGHFELSTMYHALLLEDLLDLINISQIYYYKINTQKDTFNEWKKKAYKMYLWLDSMCHPDGKISFFNDAAHDIAPTKYELKLYAESILRVKFNKNLRSIIYNNKSGYIRIQKKDINIIIDVGKIGAHYLPGHGHADVLSFEVSFGKYRAIVNSGTSCYRECNERLHQRGTAAHNTLTINGKNSSEVWGAFRCARSAKPLGLEISHSKKRDLAYIKCSHDGYKNIKGNPTHTRSWEVNSTTLKILDQIDGGFEEAIARIHFHPSIELEFDKERMTGSMVLPNKTAYRWFVENGEVSIEDSEWYPEFGKSIPSKKIVYKLLSSKSMFCIQWNN